MPTSSNLLTISSEDMVFDTLRSVFALPQDTQDFAQLSFEGFPTLQIRLRGDKFHGTITTSVMKGLLELQKAIYKSYAEVVYNSDNINKLSKTEKEALELLVKVEQGCTLLNIDGQKTLEKWIEVMGDKLTPKTLAAITLGVAVLYFAHSGLNTYLNNQKDIRMSEVSEQSQKDTLEQVAALSQIELEKMQIIANVKVQYPQISRIQEHADDAHYSMLKSFSKANEVEFSGTVISGDVADELTKTKRSASTQERLDGDYRVVSVDSSNPLVFKVKVRNITSGQEFLANVQDETLERRYRTLIQAAEWNRSPVKLNINSRMVGEEVREATVIGASAYEDETQSE